jgi:hypothetical protein
MKDQPAFSTIKHQNPVDEMIKSVGSVASDIADVDLKSQQESRWWWQRLWSGSASKSGSSAISEPAPIGDDQTVPPPPIVGFIPFQPKGFWMRIWGWFNQRRSVHILGGQALTIAQGYSVPINLLFPGEIVFTVEKEEFKEIPETGKSDAKQTGDTETAVESASSSAVAADEPISDHPKLKQVGEQLIITELTLSHLRTYYENEKEEDLGGFE